MATTRSLSKRFKIKAPVMGVPRSAYTAGEFQTKDKGLIAMLRRMPDSKVEEVVEAEDLSRHTWMEIQKMAAAKGVLRTGMGRESVERAILGIIPKGIQIA